jgi:hypothetical protein
MTTTDDFAELAGIIAATEDDATPRVVRTFDFLGHQVSIVEPTMGGHDRDGIERGYMWHAVIGDFDLEPTRPGAYDEECWVPGVARLRPDTGAELLCWSTRSVVACASAARRILRKRAGAR